MKVYFNRDIMRKLRNLGLGLLLLSGCDESKIIPRMPDFEPIIRDAGTDDSDLKNRCNWKDHKGGEDEKNKGIKK